MPNNGIRRAAGFVFGLILACSPLQTLSAADYPHKVIRIVVGFGAGGNIDSLARILADQLGKSLNAAIIVENRPGAGGNIAAAGVAKSPADGYTILLGGTNYVIGPAWYKNLQFDLLRDLKVITTLTRNANVLVVGPESNFRSVADLLQEAKSNPDIMTFASSGAGTVVHLAGELFKSQTKAAIRHVPYNAVSPAEVDIMAGRVTMMFDSLPVALPFIKDGKMKALGVTTRNRSIFAPEIPSLAEQGIADFDVSSWYAIWAPSALPNDITNVLNKAINDALVNPEFAARLTIMGGEAFGRSPADADKFVREELAKWTSAVELLGPRSN